MAEALGVVASGIAIAQVAGTAGKAIIKLRGLWNQVRTVPDTIADLMEPIDCLQPALWEFENNLAHQNIPNQFWDDSTTRRSSEYCSKALAELSDLVTDLSRHINSERQIHRSTGRCKAISKKEQINLLERRLEKAVRMLQFAQ
ncbi:Uu.00g100100.m01.CDS01 [Anthostomella pinea]|uniref:Uu.00g100100.m01.CDS01 n=1 Tax=Anthostomella pinea TaxID=933095 RepID=A0AAI8VDW9_9PEZI|nr:Uu.00g100100.m01.CDS01 [Anthostomella pinea]